MKLRREYASSHLHFVTTSTYRRALLFDSKRFRMHFVETLDSLRAEFQFRIIGYVLMPDHFHLLVWPSSRANPSRIIQSLKGRTAKFILSALEKNRKFTWCRVMLERLTLPASVHSRARHRVWQRRFYDMNIWSEEKRLEKLRYMHNNPIERGLVARPEDWPWSSSRFYQLGDASILAMDRFS